MREVRCCTEHPVYTRIFFKFKRKLNSALQLADDFIEEPEKHQGEICQETQARSASAAKFSWLSR